MPIKHTHIYMEISEKEPPVTGTTLKTKGLVPSDLKY